MTGRITNYLLRHAQVFFYSLGQLARAPFASLLTMAVIGITLALPAGLYSILGNLERIGSGWEGAGQISLFLKRDTQQASINRVLETIRRLSTVDGIEYISPEAALKEFKRLSGFGDALEALGRNPLPPVLVVKPAATQNQPQALQHLARELQSFPEVDIAQLDLEWVRRFQAVLALARRGVVLLALLLGLAVLLIIGNTSRLAILNRRDEIEIVKLIGGTNAFIRRPFLYAGLQQGVLGALAAVLLVQTCLGLLARPIRDVASLYGSIFRLEGLDPAAMAWLTLIGGALGWLGSRIAVSRHLGTVDPK